MCRRVMLGLCVAVIVASVVKGQSCPGGYSFSTQPPSELPCNPVNRFISLHCVAGSSSNIVNWYWTQDVCDAGVNGTAILPGDTSDAYQLTDFGTNNKQITFTASTSTLGYYWCEISNAVNVTVRPSTITPVLQPTDPSLPACTNQMVQSLHNTMTECAVVGSPIVFTRTPSPSSCTMVTPSTIIPSSFFSISSSITKTSVLSHSSSFLVSSSPSLSPSSSLLVLVSPSSSSIHLSSSIALILADPSSQLTPSSLPMTLSLLSSTIQTISSSSTVQQTLPSTTIQDIMITSSSSTVAISMTSSPFQLLSPSITPSSSPLMNTAELTVLVALIAICIVLAVAAAIIILAILILCVLTRKGRSKHQSAYKGGRTGDAVDGVAFRELGSQEKVNGHSNILYTTPSPTGCSLETKTPDSMIMSELYITNRPNHKQDNKLTGVQPAEMKSFSNPVYDVGLDNTPSSRSPPSSFGLGDMGSNLPAAYSQPYKAQKRHQQASGGEMYNKLTRPNTTSPPPSQASSGYSHPDVTKMTSLSPVEQDYDEVAVTPKLEHAAPVSPPTIAYYDDVAADVIPKLSHHHDQSVPHPFSHSLSPPKTIIDTEPQYDDPWESKSRGGSFRSAPRGPNLFDDPSYATPTPSPHSADSGKKSSGQFQFSVHYEVDPSYHHNH